MSRRLLSTLEILVIVLLACVPLFATFPYRVNIFLSWEGAYRISNGEIPFKDFGLPMGGAYWLVPGIFFKLFGAQMISLVKAQVFINIISGLAFRWLLKSLSVSHSLRFVSVVLYCLSYSFMNFWPWYNHTVIVYEFVALAFLVSYICKDNPSRLDLLQILAAAFFMVLSFYTKQDGGGMGFAIGLGLLLYQLSHDKRWLPLVIYTLSFGFMTAALVGYFMQYDFGYWFNAGQAPHTARVSIRDIASDFFNGSHWIKFYLFLIVILVIIYYKSWEQFRRDKKDGIFLLLVLGILVEATIFQVTSYTPPDNNIFFHGFAFAYIFTLLSKTINLDLSRRHTLAACLSGILLWWSGTYWKYIERVIDRAVPPKQKLTVSPTGENIVDRNTYIVNKDDTLDIPMSEWIYSDLKSFEKIYMPKPTVDGINRLLKMDLLQNKQSLKVLNMTELTPLAAEIPFQLERDPRYPLWYHLGVGMFNREAEMFEKRISSKYYDLVLFENIETLNNFYPFRTRTALLNNYRLVDSFQAPRRGNTQGMIEVFVR